MRSIVSWIATVVLGLAMFGLGIWLGDKRVEPTPQPVAAQAAKPTEATFRSLGDTCHVMCIEYDLFVKEVTVGGQKHVVVYSQSGGMVELKQQ
ncbi:MAG: hypothetical protein WC291_00205 [Thermodesulfovibrionales bacterium]|jgi:hypothetical protein